MPLRKKRIVPILDAKRAMTLHITAGDISRSDKKDPTHCAAALACKRMKGVKEARVHLTRVYVRQNDGNVLRYTTPARLKGEIIAFDRGGQFEPGDYTLNPPAPSQRVTGKRQGAKRLPRSRKGKATRKYYQFTNVRQSAPKGHQEIDF